MGQKQQKLMQEKLMQGPRYWVVVASQDHVAKGRELGIVQANHGKISAMKKLSPDDMIIFYSPRVSFSGKESLKKFTAIARVKNRPLYQSDMGTNFLAYRRDVEFLSVEALDILPLVPSLSFIKNKKSWGFVFRFGFFEIPKQDFDMIADKMKA